MRHEKYYFFGLIKSNPASSPCFPRSVQIPMSFTCGTPLLSLGSCEKARGYKVCMMGSVSGLQSTMATAPRTACMVRKETGGSFGDILVLWQRWPRRPQQWHSSTQSLVLSCPHLRSLPPLFSYVPANPGLPPSWVPITLVPSQSWESNLPPLNRHSPL